jgi:thiol-disulfide isomerase/thioredoxin
MIKILRTFSFAWVLALFSGSSGVLAQDALVLPPVSASVSDALENLIAGREKASVGRALKTDIARPLHEAFFAAVDLERVSLSDAVAILDAPVFTFHPERMPVLRQRLWVLARGGSGPEATLARALGLALPLRAGEAAAELEAEARIFLDDPQVPELLRGRYARQALAAIASIPKSVAEPQSEKLFGYSAHLDPKASATAAAETTRYWKRVSSLAAAPAEREALRKRLVVFISGVLADWDALPAKPTDRTVVEQTLRVLESPVTRGEFVGHPAPELKFIWSSSPELKAVSDLKGKVVVLDFWATWCGPCVQSFPNTRELAEAFRGYPVEIVGVTSLQGVIIPRRGKSISCEGDPEKEIKLLAEYQLTEKLTWTIAVSEQPVFNADYGVSGIPHMVILAPDGTVRHASVDPHAPLAQNRALIDALLKEFGLSKS